MAQPGPGDLGDRYLTLLEQAITASLYPESGWRPIDAGARFGLKDARRGVRIRSRVRLAFGAFLRARGLVWLNTSPMDPERRRRGEDWPVFGYSLVGSLRLRQLRLAIETLEAEGVGGDLVEAGVWRGGACIFMKGALLVAGDTQRRVWLYDSFAGPPHQQQAGPAPCDEYDLSANPGMAVPVEAVRQNFARFGLLDDRVMFVPGWFEDTLVDPAVERIALLRLDADLFSSTAQALEGLYPRVVPGGFVVVDDYGSWPGCRIAVDRYVASLASKPQLQWIDSHAVFWRKDA